MHVWDVIYIAAAAAAAAEEGREKSYAPWSPISRNKTREREERRGGEHQSLSHTHPSFALNQI
jgi:hypothetical protein